MLVNYSKRELINNVLLEIKLYQQGPLSSLSNLFLSSLPLLLTYNSPLQHHTHGPSHLLPRGPPMRRGQRIIRIISFERTQRAKNNTRKITTKGIRCTKNKFYLFIRILRRGSRLWLGCIILQLAIKPVNFIIVC
jgi:hypothetical protein